MSRRLTPRQLAFARLLFLTAFAAILVLLFPVALRFLEAAARNLRYLWWLILLLALGVWLIWSGSRKD